VTRFHSLFPAGTRPLIAMAHLPALPGTPLYDVVSGRQGIIDAVQRDVEVLVGAGFDGILFCNENDRPYELKAGLASAAFMARVVAECRPEGVPYGVDFLWDPECALAVSAATGASFMREVCTGAWESDMGLFVPDAAHLLRERRRLDHDDLAIFMNVTPEFAGPIGPRTPAQIAHSVAVSSIPDAILVSGSMAGSEPDESTLAAVCEAVPDDIPVLLNTGAKAATIARMMTIADGCIVGSDLKVDGYTWNRVDRERAHRFVDAARSGVS
jgi:membrane complex biogenesis BtpA family protein